MKVHWLQHVGFETLGCIAPALAGGGHEIARTRLHAGDALPAIDAFDALIVMGGPMNVDEHEAYPWLVAEKALIRAALDGGKRVLGICLGAQLIADVLSAPVTRNAFPEIGWFDVRLNDDGRCSPFFAGFPARFRAFHWHGDRFAAPSGARNLISSEACEQQAFALRTASGAVVVAIQFHLEVTAADARRWLAHGEPAPARYVQSPAQIVEALDDFAQNNRLMLRLLANWLDAA